MANHISQYSRKKSVRKTTTELDRARRRERALNMRMAGASYTDIVRANIGYNDTGAVSRDMRKSLADFTYETPEDVLILDLARIDEMQRLLTVDMRQGNLSHMSVLMRLMQFRRETLGMSAETIQERAQHAQQKLVNNGIMVVQGTTGDYIQAMAQAVGEDPETVRRELESISQSNKKPEVIDAEVVEQFSEPAETNSKNISKKSKYVVVKSKKPKNTNSSDPLIDRLVDSAHRHERIDSQREVIPPVDLDSPLLNIDIVDTESVLNIPIKQYDHNVDMVSGISYRQPPRKLTSDESRKVVVRKLKRNSNIDSDIDSLNHKTITEKF